MVVFDVKKPENVDFINDFGFCAINADGGT